MSTTDMDNICEGVSELSVLSFRKLDDVKRLAKHFRYVMSHPITQQNKVVLGYLKSLDETHRKIFLKKREGVEVEFILSTEKKSNLQRQRFNSLPVSEVPELLKAEFVLSENAKQVHICTDCNVEIELNDEEPLMESLQKHFSLEIHLPKLKRESIDVAEPILLPKMSRRLSAMEGGEGIGQGLEQIIQQAKPAEKLDKMFYGKLEASLIKLLPDKSEASINEAVRFYQQCYDKLCHKVSSIDFTTLTSSVAPIIMSIKDNVNQNFAVDANKNFENDETESPEKPIKNLNKKYRYYGPIENSITKLLMNHKLLTLVDDRTGKLAFFCIACEYYTLRFRYDSVLSHVFSETHILNLCCVLYVDKYMPFTTDELPYKSIKDINTKFLYTHGIIEEENEVFCAICHTQIESKDHIIMHILDENHLGRLSDKLYRKMKTENPDGPVPEEWGSRSLDWAKFLAGVGKPLNNRDHVVIENFIKPSSKIANYCSCCDMILKGPRQVLFNHIRQKKHLRNAAPHKLTLLYKNHCRPAEYYASFGNFYVCSICPEYVALPSFAAIVEHFESSEHVDTVTRLILAALNPEYDEKLLDSNGITVSDAVQCRICDESFPGVNEAVQHVIMDVDHQNSAVNAKTKAHKGDIISVYMPGAVVFHSEGASFNCTHCEKVYTSIRSLLIHFVYAEHFNKRPSPENFFRFYLELKHNINMLARNKYVYYDVGKLKCGVCNADVDDGENAKRHVVSPRHRENMGASYVNVSLDASAE